jgi:hypothetical protein
MAKQSMERRNTSWRISAEAKTLLELLAEKAGTSQSAVFEQAIREKARREKVMVDREKLVSASRRPAASAPPPSAGAGPEQREAALERFRQLVEKARSHDTGALTPEQIENEVALAVAEVREGHRAGRR